MPQLDLLVVTPALFALCCLVIGPAGPRLVRWVALGAIAVQVGLIASLVPAGILTGATIDGVEVPFVGAIWRTTVDGLSAPLLLLTVFIGAAAVIASWQLEERPASFFALLLLLQAAVTGVFLAENLLMFYVAWESVLIPMFFIIGGWGSSNRRHAATKYLVYSFAGGALMLVGLLLALSQVGGTASISAVAASANELVTPGWIFWLFTIAFLIKLPALPFHTWLPDAHTEAPTAGSIVLAGVLLKMGGYGLMRISVPFAPDTFDSVRLVFIVLGLAGIVYGAAMALVQTDLKRLVAYSSVSHMGFVVLAVGIGTADALGAALVTMVSHGFVAGLLFLLVGVLYARAHTRELSRFGGLGRVMPVWGVAFVFGSLASLGLPGLSGFPGEFVTLLESFRTFGAWTAVAMLGLVLAAAYNLRAVRGSVQGPIGEFDSLPDLDAREIGLASAFAIAIVAVGLQPMLVLSMAEKVLGALAQLAGGGL